MVITPIMCPAGLWGLGCLPQPRLAPSSSSPCARPCSTIPASDKELQHGGRTQQCNLPPAPASSFLIPQLGLAQEVSFPQPPNLSSSSCSVRLHISSSDLSPFHTTQIKNKSNPQERSKKREKMVLFLVSSPMSQKAKSHQ